MSEDKMNEDQWTSFFHIEEKEAESQRYCQIMNSSMQELAFYLSSPCEEDRWLASFRLKQLEAFIS